MSFNAMKCDCDSFFVYHLH